jgi:RecA/RadA recombinase
VPKDSAKRAAFRQWVLESKEWETKIFTGNMPGVADGVARIPFTWNPMLNWATGGGAAIGHFNRWWGDEGSGKSLANLGLIYAAHNFGEVTTEQYEREIYFWEGVRNKFKAKLTQKKMENLLARFPDNMSVAVYDTEQRFAWTFAEQMGIDIKDEDKLIVLDENIIENIAWQMADAVDAYHVIIVDSVGNAESMQEAGLAPGEFERGTAAQAWKRLRKVRRAMDRMENTIIFVDQVRTQLGKTVWKGKSQETPTSPPQIRFLKHNHSLSVQFSPGKKLYMADDGSLTDDYKKASNDFKALGTDGHEVAGLEMNCKLDKNSTGKPFRNAKMRFKFPVTDTYTGELVQEVGFDTEFELLLSGEHFHVIDNGGSGRFYPLDDEFQRIPKGKGKGDISWHGEAVARRAIAEDEDLRERILTRLRIDTA